MGAPIGNKFALGNTGGRPPHFKTPQELAKKASEFFELCQAEDIKATVSGLALHLGFSSRASMTDYEKRSDEFSYVVKRAKLAVELSYELSGGIIDIFALKNMGWSDRQEISHTVVEQPLFDLNEGK